MLLYRELEGRHLHPTTLTDSPCLLSCGLHVDPRTHMFDDRVANNEVKGIIVELRQVTCVTRKECKVALIRASWVGRPSYAPGRLIMLILHFARTVFGIESQKEIEPPMSSTSTAELLTIWVWQIAAASRRFRRLRNSRLKGLR
jgi:hypothetical protein